MPDVLLTFAVLRFGWRRALTLAGYAAAGVLCGSAAMYAWTVRDGRAMLDLVETLPGIGQLLIVEASLDVLSTDRFSAVFQGVLTGTPYKLYAIMAGARQFNLALLPLIALACFVRFVLSVLVTELGRRGLGALGIGRHAPLILALIWVLFYAAYLGFVPS